MPRRRRWFASESGKGELLSERVSCAKSALLSAKVSIMNGIQAHNNLDNITLNV